MSAGWKAMEDAPRDGTSIIGHYDEGDAAIMWSDCPVCMLGAPNGTFPPGWATDGSETDRNLPMDEPKGWKPIACDRIAHTESATHTASEGRAGG